MLTHDQFRANVARVPHQGTDRHAEIIYGLVKWLRPFQCVEVGSWFGHTSCWIARALQENNKERLRNIPESAWVINADWTAEQEWAATVKALGAGARLLCIDDYSLWPEQNPAVQFWHNAGLCDVGDVIDVEKVNSRAAEWPERVDFAYIDGDHSYEGCRADVWRAIELGTRCVVLHDTVSWWGPRKVADEIGGDFKGWTEISVAFDQGLTIMMKRPEKPPVGFTQEQYPEGHI